MGDGGGEGGGGEGGGGGGDGCFGGELGKEERESRIFVSDLASAVRRFSAAFHISLLIIAQQIVDNGMEFLKFPEENAATSHHRKNSFLQRAHYTPPWANTSIIGIAGSSGSGKTSLALAIVASLNLPWVVIMSMVSKSSEGPAETRVV